MRANIAVRDRLAPDVKIAITEFGTLYEDDQQGPGFGVDGGLPLPFWGAAAAFYAYSFAQLAEMGVDVLTHSQLIGSPPLPEWGIRAQQFPSVSMLDWRTGLGTAKYWVTRLLVQQLRPGRDAISHARVSAEPVSAGTPTFCGEVGSWTFSGATTLRCDDPTAVITAIDFADYGLMGGSCGGYRHSPLCSTRSTTLPYVRAACMGTRSCTVSPTELPASKFWARLDPKLSWQERACPLHQIKKKVLSGDYDMYTTSLKVQARCSHGTGTGTGAKQYFGLPVHAQAYARVPDSLHTTAGAAGKLARGRQVLLINKEFATKQVALEGITPGATGTLLTVDDDSLGGAVSSAHGIRADKWSHSSGPITLRPFAVCVLVLDDEH